MRVAEIAEDLKSPSARIKALAKGHWIFSSAIFWAFCNADVALDHHELPQPPPLVDVGTLGGGPGVVIAGGVAKVDGVEARGAEGLGADNGALFVLICA